MSNAAAAPTPEASGHPHQRVAWLELFYDLSFVGVIAAVANRVHGDPSALRILGTIGLIVIAWVGWFNVTALSNLSHGVTHWARLGIFGAMAGMVVLAVGVDDLDHGSAWLFCIGYAAARTATWPIWAMVRHRAGLGQLRPAIYGPGMAVLWIASALVPSPARWAVWAALLALELAVSQLNPSRGAYDFDAGHMLERIGLFVMLILGEAVVLIGASLAPTRELPSWTAGGLGFVLVCACWWLVYQATIGRLEEVEGAASGPRAILDFVGGGQLTIVSGLVLVAAGIGDAIGHAVAVDGHAAYLTTGATATLSGGLLLVYLGVGSLSGRLLTLTTGGDAPSAWLRAGRPIAAVAGVGAVWYLAPRLSPAAVLGLLALLTMALCWWQWARQRMVERWVAAGRPSHEEVMAARRR